MPRKKQFNVSQTSSPIPEETARRRGRPPKRFLDEGYSPPTTNKKKVPVPKKLLGKTPKASKGRPRERRKYSDDDFRGVDYPSESEESNSNDEDEVEVEREQSEGLEEVSDVEDVSKSDADVTEASIFCPWAELDPEDIPTLELPEGSADIPLPIFFLMDAIEIYEILRSFSRTLRLTPFIFEDFCAALNAPDNSCILAEIHISLMRMSLKNDDEEQTNYSVNDTNNAFNIMNHCLETMTYAEVLRQYIAAYPGVDESVLIAINADNYPYCGVESRIIVLLFLCYRFLYSQGYKKIVNNNGRIQSDDACRLCGKSTGIPVNCSRCEASFHADCVGQEDLPSDFVCQLCTLNVVHGVSDALPIGESAEREPLRLTPIGRDRHGRTYWFVVRRLFVQSEEDENDVRYYSSAPQLVELIRKLDPDYFEFDLCQFISEHINDFFEQMSQTLELTAERREKAEKDISIRTVKPENYESVLSIAYLQQDNLKRMSQILRECVAKVALNGTNGDGEKVQESLSECVISLLGIYDGRLVNSFWSGNFEEEQVLVYEESEPLDPELFFRMGDSKFDVGYNQYVNHYANNEMAESVQTRKKLADRKKYMGTRFSLNDDAEWSFEWSTAKGYGMYGNARLHAKYIEWTMGKLMRKIPPELMHRKWPSIAEEYEANLKQAGTYEKLASSLLNLECAMRRTLFLPQWWNSLGHTSLTRSTPEQREQQSRDLQKRKKEEKDIISSEFDESIVKVNYTKSPNPAVLRQKGEVYRSGGRGELGGWLWTSRTRVTASEKPEKPPLGITTYTSDEQLTTKAAKKAKRLECVVERMWDKPKWTIQTSADDQHSFSVLSQCYSPLCKAYQYKRLVCYGSSDSLAQSCYSSLCRNKMFKQVKIEDSKELIVKEIKMEQNQVMGEDIPWPIPELNSFEQRRTKKRSILVVAKAILRKLAKTAGRVPVYIPGFSTTAKSNYQVWNYPCPRPCFDLCWRWLTTNAHSLHAVALQLKILWASIRWMDMEPEDNDPDRRVVVHLHDHDERRWIVAHKEFPPFGTYERYLLKIEVIPLDEENEEEDEPWSGRNERKQRTSTRKRRTGSRIRKPQFEKEEWIDGVELKLYEIKDYWAKLNRPPATEEKPATKPINRITNGAAFSLNIEERKKRTAQRVNRDDYVYDTDPQYNDDNSFVTPQVKRPRPQPLSVASQDMDPNGYQNMTVRDAFKIQANRVYSYFPSRRTSSGFEYDGGMIRGGGRVQMPVGDGSTMRRVVFSGHGGQVAEEAVAASSLGLQDVDEVPPVIPRYDGNEQRQAAPLRQVIYATTSGQQQGNRPVYVLKRPDNQLTTGPYVVRSTNSGERVAEMSSNSLILQPGNRLVAFRTPNTARAGQMMVNPQQGTRLVRLSNGAVGRPVPVGATRYVQQVNGDGVRRVMIQNRPANFVSPQDYDGNTETFGQQRIAVASGSMSTPRFLRGGATMQMAKQQSDGRRFITSKAPRKVTSYREFMASRGYLDSSKLSVGNRPLLLPFEFNEEEEREITEAIAREEELMRIEEETKSGIVSDPNSLHLSRYHYANEAYRPVSYVSNLLPTAADTLDDKIIKQTLDTMINQVCRWDKQYGWAKIHLKRARARSDNEKFYIRKMRLTQNEMLLAEHMERLKKEVNKRRTRLENEAEQMCGLLTPWRKSRLRPNRTKPTVRKATTSHGAHVKHVVINPADISLGGDVVDWTKKSGREPSKVKTEPDSNEEDDTIASHVARRRRTSTASQEDETRRKCKEPKMSEPKDSNRRTTSRNSENERKSTEKASVSREQSPEIDMSITHCICQTMYDEKKFYVMCDTCARWFHGECVKLTEKLAARLTVWNCHECDDEAQRIKQSPQLYCICQTPYDDTKFYVGCDACEGWFHPQCVNITQEDAEEMAEYNCPSCLEAQDDDNKETGYESTSSDYSITSFSSTMPLTRIDYQRLWELLEMLLEHRLSTPFRQPVDERRYPDYRQVISQPMDLSAITKKFEALEYRSLREFVVDVTLMFENAKTYNPKSSHVFLAAERMQEVFDEKLAETRARMKATLSGEAPSSNARRHVSECHTLEGSLDIDTDQLISTQIDPNIMRYL